MGVNAHIGSTVGGYRIESVLGRGGMSVVYLAEDLRLGRRVALKVLSPILGQDASFRGRFIRESRLAAELEHPNVIPIYDAGEVTKDGVGLLYIAMRYVRGSDLESVLERQGRLGLEQTLHILGQVARALDAAQRRGLVHRDVKPANILIDESSSHVYLTDFGITKHSDTRGLTGTGMFVGTLDYAAPEQIEGLPLDGRADVYGLGCVLFECLTGRPPYARHSEIAVLHAHLVEPPPPVTRVRPDLPSGLDVVLARAMAKSREGRFSTAAELIRAVRVALAAGQADATPVTPVATTMVPPIEAFPAALPSRLPATARGGRRAQLEWLLTGGFALLALVAAIGLIAVVTGIAGPQG